MEKVSINMKKVIINKTPQYYIHPYKDLRCSTRCYLNWAKYDQPLPRYHSCKCDKFKNLFYIVD